MKKRLKWLSMMTAIAVVVGMFPIGSFAAEKTLSEVSTQVPTYEAKQNDQPITNSVNVNDQVSVTGEIVLDDFSVANQGDTIIVPIDEKLKILVPVSGLPIKVDEVTIGTFEYVNNPTAQIRIHFTDLSDPKFATVGQSVTIDVNEIFEFVDKTITGNQTFLGKTVKFVKRPKADAVNFSANGNLDLNSGLISWTITVDGSASGTPLESLVFKNLLEENKTGLYKPGTFHINGMSVDPTVKKAEVSYVFKHTDGNIATITYQTRLDPKYLYVQNELAADQEKTGVNTLNPVVYLNDTLQLTDVEGNPYKSTSASVSHESHWISVYGKSNWDEISGGVDPNKVTWFIEINDPKVNISNVLVKVPKPSGLSRNDFQTAIEEWDGGNWVDRSSPIFPDSNNTYDIGMLSGKKKRLIIVDELEVKPSVIPERKSFKLSAFLSFQEFDNNKKTIVSIDTAEAGVNVVAKRRNPDYSNIFEMTADGKLLAHWEVELIDPTVLKAGSIEMFDVLYYKSEINSAETKKAPIGKNVEGLPPELMGHFTLDNTDYHGVGMKYLEGSFQPVGGLPLTLEDVFTLKRDGKEIGQALKVSGYDFTTPKQRFRFSTIITDPSFVLNNQTKNNLKSEIKNAALLFNNDTIVGHASNRHYYNSPMLHKENIDASVVNTNGFNNPSAYKNAVTTDLKKSYDHQSNSAIVKVSWNHNGQKINPLQVWDFVNGKMSNSNVFAKEILPDGWELKEIEDGIRGYYFNGKYNSNLSLEPLEDSDNPITPITDTMLAADGQNTLLAAFNKPTVFYFRIGPKTETLTGYQIRKPMGDATYSNEGTTIVSTTNVQLADKENDSKTEPLSASVNLFIKNSPVEKRVRRVENGLLEWTVDYRPNGADHRSMDGKLPVIIDTPSSGIEIDVSNDGKVNFKMFALSINSDGTGKVGTEIPNAWKYAVYNPSTKQITINPPEPLNNYRFMYFTNIVDATKAVSNSVQMISGADVSGTPTSPAVTPFTPGKADEDATKEKMTSVKLTLVEKDNETVVVKTGKYGLYSKDGGTILKESLVDSNSGVVDFGLIKAGEYSIKEITKPIDYVSNAAAKTLTITKSGSEFMVRIEGTEVSESSPYLISYVKESTSSGGSGSGAGSGGSSSGGSSGSSSGGSSSSSGGSSSGGSSSSGSSSSGGSSGSSSSDGSSSGSGTKRRGGGGSSSSADSASGTDPKGESTDPKAKDPAATDPATDPKAPATPTVPTPPTASGGSGSSGGTWIIGPNGELIFSESVPGAGLENNRVRSANAKNNTKIAGAPKTGVGSSQVLLEQSIARVAEKMSARISESTVKNQAVAILPTLTKKSKRKEDEIA